MTRKTAADYARFIYGLCGLPPSAERERCAVEIVRRLIAMYNERGGSTPGGLREFAQEIGLNESTDAESG